MAISLQQLEEFAHRLNRDLSDDPLGGVPVNPTARKLSELGLSLSDANTYPENDQEIAKLKSALAYISPDVPRGVGKLLTDDQKPCGQHWLGSVWAIAGLKWFSGREIAEEWSKASPRYDAQGFTIAWNSYDPKHPTPISIRSLYSLAQKLGWQGNTSSTLQVADGTRFKLLDRRAIMATKPTEWRIKGLLTTTGIAAIYGPSGSGKSFLAIDMANCIASGNDWFGHRTKQTSVTYIMLEGEGGLRNRFRALETHNGAPAAPDFRAIAQPFNLTTEQDIEDIGAILPKDGVVIIDTLNRAAPGLDENSSQDMGRILSGMKRLQEITAGLVVVVHHTGKDASKGMRGHSSLNAALDGAIEVERNGNGRYWSAAKVKDGVDGEAVAFKLHHVALGVDPDGDEISSCAVGPETTNIFQRKEPTGVNQKTALASLRRALPISTDMGQAGCDPQTKCMRVEEAFTNVANALLSVLPNKRNHQARKLVQDLITTGHLRRGCDAAEEEWLWLS